MSQAPQANRCRRGAMPLRPLPESIRGVFASRPILEAMAHPALHSTASNALPLAGQCVPARTFAPSRSGLHKTPAHS